MCNNNKFAKELDTRIWKTKGSRYNKSRRYKNKNRFSSGCISILTIYVLSITIADYTKICSLLVSNHEIVTFLTIILSILILVISLHESSRGYELKAERLYNCGNELTMLYNRLRQISLTNSCNDESLNKINTEYEEIISKYRENHDPCDYSLFQAEHYKDFNLCWFEAVLIRGKYFISAYWLYFFVIICPLAILSVVAILST